MKFISFDLETTGTVAGVDRIVEVGAICFEDGQPTRRFSTLVNPLMSIPPGASRVNGIFDEMVKGQPTIDQVLGPLAEFCEDIPMVAHNSPFDTQFLVSDIKTFETTAPRGIVFDTLALARKVFPGLSNYRLETLVQHLKIPSAGFHRAEADAVYCGILFSKILERAAMTTIDFTKLLALTNRPEFRFPQIIPQPKQLVFTL
ncbi:MAG: 3'-5' exonuclease [Pseudomonadota bacterium]|nr:3'-5' exonuclease [Pseudomonadota bacterium]